MSRKSSNFVVEFGDQRLLSHKGTIISSPRDLYSCLEFSSSVHKHYIGLCPDELINIINTRKFWRLVRTVNGRSNQSQAQNFCKMATNQYCYPREGFVPEVCTHEGLCLAHAQGTPFWLSEKGDVFIRYANGRWHKRIVDTCARKSYNTRTLNGVIRGKTYPGVTYKGVHYRVHILMALAWIGSIPAGWEVDHLNGDINNWTRDNIRIVTVEENYRCAVILRARRMVARQDNDPSKDPKNMSSEELLQLFNMYNIAGDVYAGE